jgi:Hep_Hag./YadA-like C-terminal region./Haemagglutinin.
MNKKNLLLTTLVLTSLSFPVLAVDNTTGTGNGIAYGTNSNAVNTQDIAVGQSSKVENYVGQNGSVAIGYKSHVENMSGGVEASVGMGQTNYSGNMWSSARIPADPSKMVGSVAIGNNTYARTGSTMIGSHNYRGELGDVTIDTDHDGTRAASLNAYSTTVGANSFSNGAFTTNTGTYNIISSDYTGGRFSTPVKNFAATVNGSFNSVESYDSWSSTAGVANTVMGTANRVADSNGALVYGAGNEITNSRARIDNLNVENVASAKEFANKLRGSIISSNGGGATMAIGGGNKADNTRSTAIIGVNNSVIGSTASSKNNFVAGINNKLENVNNSVVIGVGDKDYVTSGLNNIVSIGTNAKVTADNSIALGSDSVANSAVATASASLNGRTYNFTGINPVGTVSVGDSDKERTITNVAAGRISSTSTDAINGSQLHSVIQEMNSVSSDTLTKANGYTDNQVNKVGAASAALAALHPLEFNKDYKWQFATGFGNYGNKTAVALGAFYQPNENILLSLGTTLGGHNNMVNGGATFRFGHNSEMNTDKQIATDAKVQELENRLKVMEEKYNELLQNQNK